MQMPKCKFYEEKQQVSHDSGTTWSDTGNYRKGELYEYDSPDCNPPIPVSGMKWLAIDNTGTVRKTASAECDTFSGITSGEAPSNFSTFLIGDCVKVVNESTFGQGRYNSVTVGDNVVFLGAYAGNGNGKIIPSSVKYISASSHEYPNALRSGLTFVSSEPPAFGFDQRPSDLPSYYPLYVPCESVGEYKTHLYEYKDDITCDGSIPAPPHGIKWKATYSDGSVVTAECSISSAITMGEIAGINASSAGLVSVEIGDCVKVIGRRAFQWNSSLSSVTISNSVTHIGSYAFDGCTSLTSIRIPSGVTSIGSYAFGNCTSLNVITIEAVTPPSMYYPYDISYYLGVNWFNNTNDCSIYVPCESVDAYREEWSVYKNRIFCDSQEYRTITYTASSKLNIETTGFTPSAAYEEFSDGVGRIKFLEPVRVIGNGGFREKYVLKSIILPDSVSTIGSNAFRGCSGLTSITIGNAVEIIDNDAFRGCSNLTSINLPNSVTSIGDRVFQGCSNLTTINIPDSVTTIGSSAFTGCYGLTGCTIGNGIKTIGIDAFTSVENVTCLAATPPTLSGIFFENTFNRDLKVPRGCVIEYISKWRTTSSNILPIESPLFGEIKWKATYSDGRVVSAFCDTSSSITRGEIGGVGLVSVEIGNSVKYIEHDAFNNFLALNNIVIGSGVTSIGDTAFYNCQNLKNITIPSNVKNIGWHAFSESGLINIILEPTKIPLMDNSFYHILEDCILFVPCESIIYYRRKWSEVSHRITCI